MKIKYYNMKNIACKLVLTLFFIFGVLPPILCALAEDSKIPDAFAKIISSVPGEEVHAALKETTKVYFKENKYNECVEYLRALKLKNSKIEAALNCYIALARYYQLKYLEESQNWNEYFSSGNDYRSQIQESAQKAIDKTESRDPSHISSRLILWRMYKDQENNIADAQLSELMNAVAVYAKDAASADLVKDVAEQLKSYGEKIKAKELYRIYVDKVIASSTKDDDIELAAGGFYKEGNLELSKIVYDAYLEIIAKTLPKEKFIAKAVAIAKQFSYQSQGAKDLVYSEKVMRKLEEIGGKDVFDEELLYVRAFDLEKAKEYLFAKAVYEDFLSRYPQSKLVDQINYKLGLFAVYVSRDIKNGRIYFEKLIPTDPLTDSSELSAVVPQKEKNNLYVVSSLYQLGLLSQWELDNNKAAEYYNKGLQKAGSGYVETVNLIQKRLKDISESKPIEYNLKTFLDLSLKPEGAGFDMSKAEVRTSVYYVKKADVLKVSSSAYIGETGCMQVKLEYLWSGDLGNAEPSTEDLEFDTAYLEEGVKQINVVVVSSLGVIDRAVYFIDVY